MCCNAYTNADSDGNCDGYGNAHCDCDCDCNVNANTAAYAYGAPAADSKTAADSGATAVTLVCHFVICWELARLNSRVPARGRWSIRRCLGTLRNAS